MIQLTEKIFCLKVPEDADLIEVTDGWIAYYQKDVKGPQYVKWIELSPGNWQYLFTSNEATEEDARKIVPFDVYEKEGTLAANYLKDGTGDCKTCLDSFRSLLKSKQLEGNHAILELTDK